MSGNGHLFPIPDHWEWASFDRLARVAAKLVDPTLTPDAVHIAPNHIESWTARLLPYGTVETDGVKSSKHRFFPGQILYSKIRPYLAKATLARFEGVCSADMYPIESSGDARFLLYWMLSPWFTREASNHQGRTVLPKINKAALGRLPVPVPPVAEQTRIADKIEELFSDLDAGVVALNRAKANLKRYRAAVLKAAVEGKLTQQWRADHPDIEPASELLQRILTERRHRWEQDQLAKYVAKGKQPPNDWQDKYKVPAEPDQTDLPEDLPASWTIASMEQLTSTVTSGSRDWSQYYGEGTGTFLMAQNVRPGRLDLSFRQAVNPPAENRDRERSQVCPDDLLVTIVGANTGDVCRVPQQLPEHYVCQSVALMRPVDARYSRYLETYMVAEEGGQRQYRRYIYGQGRPHLSFDQIKMTPVVLPPLNEQSVIVDIVDQELSVIEQIESQLATVVQRSTRLRQSILKRAFAGHLVPQDPNDEPATELLTRINTERATHESGQHRSRRRARTSHG